MNGRTSGASKFNIDKFSEVLGLRGMEKVVSEMILQWMRSSILSQCRDLSTGVICSVLGVPVTAPAREFCSSWRRDICSIFHLFRVEQKQKWLRFSDITQHFEKCFTDYDMDTRVLQTRATRHRLAYDWRQICNKNLVFICTLGN